MNKMRQITANWQKMALKDKPITIDADTWYYEEFRHITIVHEIRDTFGNYEQTIQIKIPWKRMLESVSRKYNIEAKAGKRNKRGWQNVT